LTGARYHHLPLEIFALAGGCNFCKFHQEQSFSITNHPQTNHFWPSQIYKGAGPFFVTCFSLSSFTVEVSSPHELHTDFRPPFFFTQLSLSLFLSTLNCYYRVMSPGPVQSLPSFNFVILPDHYKTVLPNISYPSRPITHIPWSGSSAPLHFSVSQNFIFFVFCRNLTFFFCP
jgi:hypothetical protein